MKTKTLAPLLVLAASISGAALSQTPVVEAVQNQPATRNLSMGRIQVPTADRIRTVVQGAPPAAPEAVPAASTAPAPQRPLQWTFRADSRRSGRADRRCAPPVHEVMQALVSEFELLRQLVRADAAELIATYCEKVSRTAAVLLHHNRKEHAWGHHVRLLMRDVAALRWSSQVRHEEWDRMSARAGSESYPCDDRWLRMLKKAKKPREWYLDRAARRCVECHHQYGGPGRVF